MIYVSKHSAGKEMKFASNAELQNVPSTIGAVSVGRPTAVLHVLVQVTFKLHDKRINESWFVGNII